jgi:hypothetical protein
LHQLNQLCALIGFNRPVFDAARRAARRSGKPLLNAGCKTSFVAESDVNLDLVRRDVPRFVRGDVQDLRQFPDKWFGAAYASHVLEHVADPVLALAELDRVAEEVFVITPAPFWPWTWLHPDHRWILINCRVICRVPRRLRAWLRRLMVR